MAIHFRCPNCGSKMSVEEIHAGKTANCPACWDPVRVPSCSALHGHVAAHPDDLLDASLPRLMVHAIKLGIWQHSRYFMAGLFLLVFFLLFVCGGVAGIQRLFRPSSDEAPTKGDFDKPARLWEMRQTLEGK